MEKDHDFTFSFQCVIRNDKGDAYGDYNCDFALESESCFVLADASKIKESFIFRVAECEHNIKSDSVQICLEKSMLVFFSFLNLLFSFFLGG